MPLVGDPVDIPYFDVTIVETWKLQWCYESGKIATKMLSSPICHLENARENRRLRFHPSVLDSCAAVRDCRCSWSVIGGLIFEQPGASAKK
jgi:hypothetical protein